MGRKRPTGPQRVKLAKIRPVHYLRSKATTTKHNQSYVRNMCSFQMAFPIIADIVFQRKKTKNVVFVGEKLEIQVLI